MRLLRIFSWAVIAAVFGTAASAAEDTGGNFSNILSDVGAYGRAISIARACGMTDDRADRAVSMVMVYAYAAAKPNFSDVDGKRMFLVEVVERVSRRHKVEQPAKALCARSFKALDHLPRRLDEAVRRNG